MKNEKMTIAAAGVLIGLIAAMLVFFGNPVNMGFCIACFLRDTSGALGLHSAAAVQYIRPEIIGLVLGEASSMLFGIFAVSTERRPNRRTGKQNYSLRLLTKDMLLTAAPVTGNRVCMNLLSSAEAILIPFTLQQYGLSAERALSVYGTLSGMSMSFILFPNVLTNAVSVMLLPAVSESQAAGQNEQLRQTIRKTFSFCLFLGTVFMLLFLLTGKFLGRFFFNSEMAGDFIITLAWICPFLYLNGTLHSILNGLGKTGAGFFNNLTGIMIRIIFILLFVPKTGIQGYLWGLLANQLLVALMNLNALREFLFSKKYA